MKNIRLNTLLFLACFAYPSLAYSVPEVRSPDVDQGEYSFEFSSDFMKDGKDKKLDNSSEYQAEVSYGFTDNFGLGLEMAADRNRYEGIDYNFTGIEGTYQFTKQGQNSPVAMGIRTEYETVKDGADSIGASLLFGHDAGQFDYLLNVGLESEFGAGSKKDVSGDIRAGAKYKLSEIFQPGVEYHSKTGELRKWAGFEDQNNRLGPVIYGALLPHLEYEAGYLYGLTDDAADNTFKINLEYKVELQDLKAF